MKKMNFRSKIMLVFVTAMILSMLGCWILAKLFLKDFYIARKVKELNNCYENIEKYLEDNQLSEDGKFQLEKISAKGRLAVMIIDPDAEQRFLYINDAHKMETMRMLSAMQCYLNIGNADGTQVFQAIEDENEHYTIYQMQDKYMDMNSLDLFGKMDNGCYVFIRASYQSIENAADIASRFLAYSAVLMLLLGAIGVHFVCKAMISPVEQMSAVAKRMCRLDFDVKYPVKGEDEIAILGESLNQLSEKLECTIRELKQANNELQSDLDRKTEIDNMRTEFLSNVSHELKTPIALIQGYAEGLKDNISEDASSRDFYCDVIIDESQRMNKMVKKLLTLNQIEFGQNQMDYERFDIVALLQAILDNTEIMRTQKGVTLHFHEKGPVYVWADEFMIEEVVTNYISNALNHVSKSKEIAVSLKKMDAKVRISVYNTGEQIPEDSLDKVWIKFYKVDKARTREYGGSGIGLSIVKAIMDAHNEQCGVINHTNGVEFWFELDLAETDMLTEE